MSLREKGKGKALLLLSKKNNSGGSTVSPDLGPGGEEKKWGEGLELFDRVFNLSRRGEGKRYNIPTFSKGGKDALLRTPDKRTRTDPRTVLQPELWGGEKVNSLFVRKAWTYKKGRKDIGVLKRGGRKKKKSSPCLFPLRRGVKKKKKKSVYFFTDVKEGTDSERPARPLGGEERKKRERRVIYFPKMTKKGKADFQAFSGGERGKTHTDAPSWEKRKKKGDKLFTTTQEGEKPRSSLTPSAGGKERVYEDEFLVVSGR